MGGLMAYIIPSKSGIIGISFLSITTILGVYHLIFLQGVLWTFQFEWLPGYLLGFSVDRSSAILILLVSLISLLVHIFSIFYLSDDKHKDRYYLKLGGFTFSMLGLLMSDHLILLFIFWELVGFSSYLLIIFCCKRTTCKSSLQQNTVLFASSICDIAWGCWCWWFQSIDAPWIEGIARQHLHVASAQAAERRLSVSREGLV